jgi:hypothetical protein
MTRHVRRLRATLACQVENVGQGIAGYFPPGTRISILSGVLFSATGRWKTHLGRTSDVSPRYSVRKAVMGSTRPARRAGR